MFATASVNNIIAVNGGIEHFFDEADVPNAVVQMPTENDVEEKIISLPSVDEVKSEHLLTVFSSKFFKHNGKKLDNFINAAFLISEDEMGINYFDEDNNIIESVDKGCFYATSPFLHNTDIQKGDEIELEIGDSKLTLKFMGRFKDAVFSTQSSVNPMLIIDSADYEYLDKDEACHTMSYTQLFISTSDVDSIKEFAKSYEGVDVSTRDELKSIYIYDIVTAYIMMAISIILMLTAFVVLRFAIGFTISEEFREIGIMKAVGIGNGSIRALYIVKYLAISVVGAVIGFFGSIPLGDMMMKTVSENMVLGIENGSLMGFISSTAVVLIILIFCYGCTRRVNNLSPIDAVRNGQTGERFRKKSVIHLRRSKLPSTVFMALNDILSAPKQFGIITVIFTLCILMTALMSNFALTLKSEKILWLFNVPTSEAHILDADTIGEVLIDMSAYKHIIADTEKLLEENGMSGKCTMTIAAKSEAAHKDKKASILFGVIKGDTDDTLRIDEGIAPQKNDEVALTLSALRDLDAQIGDRITAVIDDKEYEFIITGRFSSFNSSSAYLYKDFDLGELPADSTVGVQIHFDGNPDKETIDRNVEKIKELIDSDKVYNTSDMISTFTGISGALNTIKQMMMILTAIVTALIVVLLERSFISKEKSEIALMKAVGIPNGSIIAQHTLRFVIVSVLACIISLAVLMPISNVMMNWICSMIGDVEGIKCDIDPVEIFAVCPAILLTVTIIGSFLTALYTRTIKASDTASIE
ncbi:MAG: ABC transporter permease [Ruminococcus flavefaciens]|nr:ABC transporter permease [Ruminococcus flavefaciens]